MEYMLPGQLSPTERRYAAAYLEGSKDLLLRRVNRLQPDEWDFRPAPGEWSIAECIEHLCAAEDFGWQWLQGALRQPVESPEVGEAAGHGENGQTTKEPGRRPGAPLSEAQVIALMTDRTHKFKTMSMLEPGARFADPRAALDHFISSRQSFIAYVETTNDDLKHHFVTHPVTGRIDLYQLLILQSAHLMRHFFQIKAIQSTIIQYKITNDYSL